MREFQLTHVALVGARISEFYAYGFHARDELAGVRVAPGNANLEGLDERQLQARFRHQLPIWIHNILVDHQFPQRGRLLMPLRRFEGELHDHKENEVVSAVLSAGFRNQTLDPLNLPECMPMRQRCLMVMQIGIWQEAFRQLEDDLILILAASAPRINRWLDSTGEPCLAPII